MHYRSRQFLLLFFLLNTTFSYAQFEKQILLKAEGSKASNSPYRVVAFLDADQDGDQDIVAEVVSDPTFTPININFNSLLEDNARNWNNLQQPPQANSSIALTNVNGETTGATLTINTTWNGSNQNGYDDDRKNFYPRAVTRSYYFTGGTEEVTISGLDSDKTFQFSFYGSSFSDEDRTSVYRIGSQEVELNASFNTTDIVSIENVTPSSEGVVTVEIARKAGSKFGYLGAMVIELNRREPQQYQLLTNGGRTPFSAGIVVDQAANWSFGKAVDINDDSYPDIIAYDTEDQQLLWYENQDGTAFSRKTVSGANTAYISENRLFVLDVNQDGALDILVKEGPQLYWYEQTDSGFADRDLWAEGSDTDLSDASVVQGDIDGDNLPDIIWQSEKQLYFLTSTDSYALGDPTEVIGVDNPIALAVTDMNGDNKSDLLITEAYNWTGSYRIGYLANGESGLDNSPTFLTISDTDWLNLRPNRLQANDIDKDGDLDFYVYLAPEACSSVVPAQTGWIENQGNWGSAQYHVLSDGEAQWTDLDQDGDQDLIDDSNLSGISWVENAKAAWDSTAYQSVDQPVVDRIAYAIAEQKNNVLTGVSVQSTHHVAQVVIKQGTLLPPQIQANVNSGSASFAQADIDADGVAELLVANVNADGFAVVRWKNSTDGTINELVTHRGEPSAQRIFVSSTGLLLAPINEAGDRYGWWKQTGSDFVRSGTIEGTVTQLVDLNADNALDILTDRAWYRNISNNRFEQSTAAKGNYVADLDGDGDTDVINAPETGNKTWYINQGSGSFTSKTLSVGSEKVLGFADLDQDKNADVIQSSASGLSWRKHTDGAGTFGSSTAIDDFVASDVQSLDTDADGDIDLIAYDQQTVVKYKNAFQQQENTDPEVLEAIEDQIAEADTIYQFQVPADAFKDNDTGDVLTYSARLESEDNLPAWLSFTAETRTFSGTPVLSDTGIVTIQVQVADSQGATANQSFQLTVVAEDTTTTEPGDGGEEPGDGGEGPITGIGDEPDSEFVLYPNPIERGRPIVIKNVPLHQLVDARVYSSQGKELSIRRQNEFLYINSATLPSGVYLVVVKTTEQVHRRRVVVE